MFDLDLLFYFGNKNWSIFYELMNKTDDDSRASAFMCLLYLRIWIIELGD